MSPQKIKEAYKFVDEVSNLFNFYFDDITKCSTYIESNLRKNSSSKRSLSKMMTCHYQGLFIDFRFSDQISYDKEEKFIPSSCEYI